MADDFANFAFDVSKAITTEECERMTHVMFADLERLMQEWAEQVVRNVNDRLVAVGLQPDFEVEIFWQPSPPVMKVTGKSYKEDEDD
jgi:hypothetical protein